MDHVGLVGVPGGWGSGRLERGSGGWWRLTAVPPGMVASLPMALTLKPFMGRGGRRSAFTGPWFGSWWPANRGGWMVMLSHSQCHSTDGWYGRSRRPSRTHSDLFGGREPPRRSPNPLRAATASERRRMASVSSVRGWSSPNQANSVRVGKVSFTEATLKANGRRPLDG